jgi:hypothetical protein
MPKVYGKVRVYWNLHKLCWSIQDTKTNKVIRHTDKIQLANATFVVRQGGQDRVQLERRKNVHAFAVGYEYHMRVTNPFGIVGKAVMYNPYLGGNFRYVDTREELPTDWIGNIYLHSDITDYKIKPRVEIMDSQLGNGR